MRYLIFAAIALMLSGCASTNIAGYTDPSYTSKTYESTAVFVAEERLDKAAKVENDICDKFSAQGVSCQPIQNILPPTRQYSEQTVQDRLISHGIRSVVVIFPKGDRSASQLLGYQKFANVTASSNQAAGQSTGLAIRSYSRVSHTRVALLDAKTGQTVWLGDATTNGKGLLNVTDSAFNSSLSGKVVAALTKSGHFPVQKD